MDYLLDTSVYSQPLRRKPVRAALERWKKTGDKHLSISIVTLSEVEFGLAWENNPLRRDKFDALLRYRLPILPTDDRVWSRFAILKARQQATVEPVSDLDLLLAATAIAHNLYLATLNRKAFSRVESLRWEDWSR